MRFTFIVVLVFNFLFYFAYSTEESAEIADKKSTCPCSKYWNAIVNKTIEFFPLPSLIPQTKEWTIKSLFECLKKKFANCHHGDKKGCTTMSDTTAKEEDARAAEEARIKEKNAARAKEKALLKLNEYIKPRFETRAELEALLKLYEEAKIDELNISRAEIEAALKFNEEARIKAKQKNKEKIKNRMINE